MRKYLWIAVIALIACAVYFTSCERIPKEMMDTIMPDAEPVEETTEPEPDGRNGGTQWSQNQQKCHGDASRTG